MRDYSVVSCLHTFCPPFDTSVQLADRIPIVSKGNLIPPLTKEEGHYEGSVYLLISHHTFSSAGSFAWAFKEFGMGTVIGEESGGMNVSFGDIIYYKLPVSGLSCTISFKRFWQYGADEKEIHGTLPDYAVPQEDALAKAFQLIKK